MAWRLDECDAGAVPPEDPLRKEYPPLPDKPPPFDLDALKRISKPETRRFRWRRGKGLPQLEEAAPKVTTARSSVALLALIPDPEQCVALREALAEGGAPVRDAAPAHPPQRVEHARRGRLAGRDREGHPRMETVHRAPPAS